MAAVHGLFERYHPVTIMSNFDPKYVISIDAGTLERAVILHC
jgi:hypothetical protein